MAVKRRNSPVEIIKPKLAFLKNLDTIRIKKVEFPRGFIKLLLSDGSIIFRPIKNYPGIAKLTLAQRKKHVVSGGEAVDFNDAPEVYHISDFLGGEIRDYQK